MENRFIVVRDWKWEGLVGGMATKGQPEGDLSGEWFCVLIVAVFAPMCTWGKQRSPAHTFYLCQMPGFDLV